MALTNIKAMLGGRITYFDFQRSTSRNNLKSNRNSGMAFQSDCTKPRTFASFTIQIIHSGTSFMPWSCKIPIGYHEFL
ncbi:hypothetical protein FRX31_005582 [Thalictrum thalictroides]|uniref:Uncharacterized protein n=1 Tax=Thalictrum thalictroides TaxID=46969 RepID=A0A7J6X504_THATH|nr:hypothetical protein FRX31_005582 [Thalictrum thalictroides]